jgi:hypothetical protein
MLKQPAPSRFNGRDGNLVRGQRAILCTDTLGEFFPVNGDLLGTHHADVHLSAPDDEHGEGHVITDFSTTPAPIS